MSGWIRYRFYSRSVEDMRPLIFNPAYPWWCTGHAGDDSSVSIVAYLPPSEPLERYWDDAFEIDAVPRDQITFSSRFPKPDYYVETGDENYVD